MGTSDIRQVVMACLRKFWASLEHDAERLMSYVDTHDEKAITVRLVDEIRSTAKGRLEHCIGRSDVRVEIEAWNVQQSSKDEGETGADLGIVVGVYVNDHPEIEKVLFLQAKRLEPNSKDWVLRLNAKDKHDVVRAKKQAEKLRDEYPRKAGAFLLYGMTEFGTRIMSTTTVLNNVDSPMSSSSATRESTRFSQWMDEVAVCTHGSRNKRLINVVRRTARGKLVRSRKAVTNAIDIEVRVAD